jgi:hypothetical protein
VIKRSPYPDCRCPRCPSRTTARLALGIAFASGVALLVALAGTAAHAEPMVCTTKAGVTHCEAPLRHYSVTGIREGNRTYFADSGGRHWMMIEEDGLTTIMPVEGGPKGGPKQ